MLNGYESNIVYLLSLWDIFLNNEYLKKQEKKFLDQFMESLE